MVVAAGGTGSGYGPDAGPVAGGGGIGHGFPSSQVPSSYGTSGPDASLRYFCGGGGGLYYPESTTARPGGSGGGGDGG